MDWKLNKNRPICPQICEQICVKIASGQFLKGEKLMSVREVAVQAGVNPNTVQKAFEQLEAEGLIYSVRSLGWFVGENTELARKKVEQMILEKTDAFLVEMQVLGLTADQVKHYVEERCCDE